MSYTASFELDGKRMILSDMQVNSTLTGFNEMLVRNHMINGNQASIIEVNIAAQVLCKYPNALKILVTLKKEISQNVSQNGNANPAALVLVLAASLGLIFAPILVALGMNGKFVLSWLYLDAIGGKYYEKFKKFYVIVGLGYFAVFIILFILSLCGLKDLAMSITMLPTINIIYFAISFVATKLLYKKDNQK